MHYLKNGFPDGSSDQKVLLNLSNEPTPKLMILSFPYLETISECPTGTTERVTFP